MLEANWGVTNVPWSGALLLTTNVWAVFSSMFETYPEVAVFKLSKNLLSKFVYNGICESK